MIGVGVDIVVVNRRIKLLLVIATHRDGRFVTGPIGADKLHPQRGHTGGSVAHHRATEAGGALVGGDDRLNPGQRREQIKLIEQKLAHVAAEFNAKRLHLGHVFPIAVKLCGLAGVQSTELADQGVFHMLDK